MRCSSKISDSLAMFSKWFLFSSLNFEVSLKNNKLQCIVLPFVSEINQGSANTGQRRNCYRAVRSQGQLGPKVTGTTDIRNTLLMPLNTIIPTGQGILLRKNKPRYLIESVSWWPTSCNKLACAKHSLFYWGPVRKILPGWNRSAVWKRLPTPETNNFQFSHTS